MLTGLISIFDQTLSVTDIVYWPEVDGFNCPGFDGSFVKKGEATVLLLFHIYNSTS